LIKELKKSVFFVLILFLAIPAFSQTPPPLGIASTFVIFTSTGAVTNAGTSQITGNIGTGAGAITLFGNINGNNHNADAMAIQAALDLSAAYTDLSNQVAGTNLALAFGAGQVLSPDVYLVPGASTFSGSLTLDGGGDANACFVFKLDGAFAASSYSSIILTNGTQACNVFWLIDGAVAIAEYSIWKGTLVVDGAIALATQCELEGRLLDIAGEITVSNFTAGPPIGCGSPIFTGPPAPDLNSLCDFAIFSTIGTTIGTISNSGTTNVTGDIGTNNGTVVGFNPIGVAGTIHPVPDAATAQATTDLNTLYPNLNALPHDIELLFPAQFGQSQVLTPHVYLLSTATTLTGTIFLDARGVSDAVFVIRIMGALTTSIAPQVVLLGGTKAENVFWQVEGAVTIGSTANFNGIIVSNNGAIILETGVVINGKALTTNGNITTTNVNATTLICPSLLPIELISFNTQALTHKIELSWVTVSEKDNAYFNIERSGDGVNFTSIFKTDGAGNSSQIINYSAIDETPLNGISYYRLKQTDYDGEASYSDIKSVEFNLMDKLTMNIYPNPFSGKTTFSASSTLKQAVLTIYNLDGKKVKQIENISGQTCILDCENLSNGLYFINLLEDGKIVATDKLVIAD
jgi:hypothetical protein